MKIVARFHVGKLVVYGGFSLLFFAAACWMLATGHIDGSRAISSVGGALIIAGIALVTGTRILLWRGPAIHIEHGVLHAFGQKQPIPISEIDDIQVSASNTDSENWTGVILYRDGKALTRLHSWLLDGDRRRIALRLRAAVGLPAEGLRR